MSANKKKGSFSKEATPNSLCVQHDKDKDLSANLQPSAQSGQTDSDSQAQGPSRMPQEHSVWGPGYLVVPRSLFNHWSIPRGKSFSKREALMYLWWTANFTSKTWYVPEISQPIDQGSFITSIVGLSSEWQWSVHKVRSFLKSLVRAGEIILLPTSKFTMITICGYDGYREFLTAKKQRAAYQNAQQKSIKPPTTETKNLIKEKKQKVTTDFSVIFRALDGDKKWHEDIITIIDINEGKLKQELSVFVSHMIAECKVYSEIEEYKGHFKNWLISRRKFLERTGTGIINHRKKIQNENI